jgi:hypothetical protein
VYVKVTLYLILLQSLCTLLHHDIWLASSINKLEKVYGQIKITMLSCSQLIRAQSTLGSTFIRMTLGYIKQFNSMRVMELIVDR